MTAEEEAYNFLLEGICGGRYRKGDRLIAEDIASEIGMSRMPVREAFRRLDAQGLVTLRPNRGAVVSGLDIERCTKCSRCAVPSKAWRFASRCPYRRAPVDGAGTAAR
jgi:DNA-binding GntR family transcriptional regulator